MVINPSVSIPNDTVLLFEFSEMGGADSLMNLRGIDIYVYTVECRLSKLIGDCGVCIIKLKAKQCED